MNSPSNFTVVSTFSGCGGSSLGYQMAGGKVRLAVEWDANAAATYRENFPGTPVYHGDIAALSVDDCCRLAGVGPGELDVLDGSPPCQGFSTAGRRDFGDSRNQLFREYVRLLRGLRPKAFVMENVSGMVKDKMKLVFAECLRELKASGYRVKVRLLNAKYFGVPQNRERLIFIGARNDLGIEPQHPVGRSAPVPLWKAWADIPDHGRPAPRASALKISNWRETPVGGHHHKRFTLSRLAWNRPSPTVLKTLSGGSGLMHPDEPRHPTEGELKRIGSFPDSFRFVGKYADVLARIGNSVPPLLMKAVAECVRDTILRPAEAEGLDAARADR
jgi:DNA (cytosine-5)-methyltransferase 1